MAVLFYLPICIDRNDEQLYHGIMATKRLSAASEKSAMPADPSLEHFLVQLREFSRPLQSLLGALSKLSPIILFLIGPAAYYAAYHYEVGYMRHFSLGSSVVQVDLSSLVIAIGILLFSLGCACALALGCGEIIEVRSRRKKRSKLPGSRRMRYVYMVVLSLFTVINLVLGGLHQAVIFFVIFALMGILALALPPALSDFIKEKSKPNRKGAGLWRNIYMHPITTIVRLTVVMAFFVPAFITGEVLFVIEGILLWIVFFLLYQLAQFHKVFTATIALSLALPYIMIAPIARGMGENTARHLPQKQIVRFQDADWQIVRRYANETLIIPEPQRRSDPYYRFVQNTKLTTVHIRESRNDPPWWLSAWRMFLDGQFLNSSNSSVD